MNEDKYPYGKSIFALELMKHIEKVLKEDKPIIINVTSKQRMGMSTYAIRSLNKDIIVLTDGGTVNGKAK